MAKLPLQRDRDFPIFKSGVEEGRRQMQARALTFLEEKYLAPDVARDSAEAKATLDLARELSNHLKKPMPPYTGQM